MFHYRNVRENNFVTQLCLYKRHDDAFINTCGDTEASNFAFQMCFFAETWVELPQFLPKTWLTYEMF